MISEVAIRYKGATTVDEVRLQSYLRTTVGSRYKSEWIDDDIRSLYESGLVNDVRVLADPKRSGVEVIFEVQTRGMMGPGPGFAGNTVFSDERLAKQTGLLVGQKIDAPALAAAAKRVEAYYHANGYPRANVSARTQPAEDGSMDFIFIIEEGPGPGKRDRG
jgi:outer membrane protein insertion porin family